MHAGSHAESSSNVLYRLSELSLVFPRVDFPENAPEEEEDLFIS